MNGRGETALLAPRRTAGVAPVRRAGSVRRSSTIDVSWPDGAWHDMLFTARARDVRTPAGGGAPLTCAEDSFAAVIDTDRAIREIRITPSRPAERQLVGQRGGGHLRQALEEIMPEERASGTPLYLILDDISGASLVANWAWSQWTDDWIRSPDGKFDEAHFDREMKKRIGICAGFVPGGAVLERGPDRKHATGAPTPDLRNPEDPAGWHDYAVQQGVGMRRARRIDVSRGERGIVIDAMFQDSGTRPDGGREALHEYSISALVDPDTLRIVTITAEPRVLPWPECPGATKTLSRLEGEPLSDLRRLVLERLRGTAGCTHLNDALRSLAEVPHLVRLLEAPNPGDDL